MPSRGADADPDAVANPYKGERVGALHITGIEERLASELQGGLALAQRHGLLRRKPELYPSTLEKDVARTKLWLARHGYPQATITPSVERRDDDVVVKLAVDPGPPSILASLSIEGWPQDVERPAPPESLKKGRRFADGPASHWATLARTRLREAGYAFAVVDAQVSTENDQVTLTLLVEPGEQFRVTELRVTGCSEDLVPLVRKKMEIEPGERFSPKAIEEAELRLRQLDLFRQIKLTVDRTGTGELAVVAELLDRPPRTIETGAGYWTDELFRVHAMWRHRNLFRAGRGFQVDGAWSIHRREGGASTWWPGLLGSRTRVTLSGRLEQQIEDSYDLLSLETSLGVRYRPTLTRTWNVALLFGNVDVTEKTDDPEAFTETGGTLLSVEVSWLRDTSDDPLDPTRGTVVSISSERTVPGRPSDAHFVTVESSAAGYHSLAEGWVSASHVVLGWARPLEDSEDLLPNKRFYAGGSTSMRGFARRRLGPVDDAGKPLGGEAKVELSTEIRFPLVGKWRGAAFVDAGQVWSRRTQIDLSELEFAVGPGLMFKTPLGPVRADVGFRLTRIDPTAPNVQFHLTIGHPY
jgi:outer membrane protein assembly complex protein YaeT